MTTPLENARQASVGEESLLVPDHHTDDSSRESIKVRTFGAVHFGNKTQGRHSTGSANQPPTENSLSRLSALRPYHMSDSQLTNYPRTTTLGEVGTFRSAALARKWVNTSRRNILRGGEGLSERTPLVSSNRDSIPENEESKIPTSFPVQYDTVDAIKSIVFGKVVSIFLLLIPLAFWSHYAGWNANYIFWINFLVMIPLAAILGDFTEEAALHTNETVGGLLNATFGNAVEVVVGIQALLANEIRVVQASMIGSIFSNLLLVLGCCFFFGGMIHKEQTFNATAATANMGLLALSSIALVLPTPFAEYYDIQDEHVLAVSRFVAVFLLFMYLQLLIFQLHTHKHIFEEKEEGPSEAVEEEEEQPSISMPVALIGLLITTLSVTIFSDFLVASIDEFCEVSGVSRTFVGLIILPIVGNAVEHITAVTVAMKDKMDLAMGVAVGSCTQISLFVVPLTVLVGWAADKPMTLNFPHFEITLYILSVFTVSVCLSNPKGNWLEGSLLITTYIMIAIGFWFEKVVDFR